MLLGDKFNVWELFPVPLATRISTAVLAVIGMLQVREGTHSLEAAWRDGEKQVQAGVPWPLTPPISDQQVKLFQMEYPLVIGPQDKELFVKAKNRWP